MATVTPSASSVKSSSARLYLGPESLHHGRRELWSADRDFTRFEALSVSNPLVFA